jgi:hypothetical protein
MRASRAADEIGVVVHGPEVVDSGWAKKALDLLETVGPVTAVLGGTMGRVAVIDANLEDRIDISKRETPSRSVRRLEPTVSMVILLNYAKTRETGLAFGAMVAERAKPKKPLMLADYGGRFLSVLAKDPGPLAERIAQLLNLEILRAPEFQPRTESSDGIVRRKILGAVPGENVSVNGTVVAKALADTVEIFAIDGKIIEISGAQIKAHGLEKLSSVDLKTAILRTGEIRRTENAPTRTIVTPGHDAALIDHAAEETFEDARGAMVAVTVGDDTTAIAGEVLARLGTPLVGIVDGDLDHLCARTAKPAGSVVIEVRPGTDDLVGRRVREVIFGGEGRISMNGLSIEDLVEGIKKIAGDDFMSERRF